MEKREFKKDAEFVLTRLRELIDKAPDGDWKKKAEHAEAALKTSIKRLEAMANRMDDPLAQLAETGDLDGLRSELLKRRW